MSQVQRSHWTSRIGFVLASAGGAVGLGNIWRFPYMTGENGGSIFILIYLGCVILLGLPVMIAEVLIGKTTQLNPVGAFRQLAGSKSPWQVPGYMGILTAFTILSFYSVVAGWCIAFLYKAVTGVFSSGISFEEINNIFKKLTSSPIEQGIFHSIFMFFTVLIVYAGVKKGLQRWSEILMPLLILIIIILIGYGLTLSGAKDGMRFLLEPQPNKLTHKSIMDAVGQCFFSLSLGMGAMLTYGSYMDRKDKVVSPCLWVVFMDSAIALLAGIAVFTIVFTYTTDLSQGPGLVFVVLPNIFSKMPLGTLFAILFFTLLFFAAITSAISLLEVITAYFIDQYDMPRSHATIIFGTICLIIGVGCIFSGEFFDFLDKLSTHYLLPIGGFMISLFAGWKLDQNIVKSEFQGSWYGIFYYPWLICVRVICPTLILLVFLRAHGVI